MKRMIPLVVAMGLSAAMGFWLRGQQHAVPASVERAKARAIQEAMAPPAVGEKIVHTFEDEAALRQFASLWQQRQMAVFRVAMLEGYATAEQTTLTQIDKQLQSQYSLDPSRGYSLNAAQRVIVEREPQAAPAGEAAAQPEAPSASAPAAKGKGTEPAATATAPSVQEKIVHTFADEAAVEEFAKLWQQRQNVIARMAMLKSYREAEKNTLAQFEKKFAGDYSMDLKKQHTLDQKQRVLIEREPPSTPKTAEAQPIDSTAVEASATPGQAPATATPQAGQPAQ